MSAEERLAALLHAFAIGCDRRPPRHTDDARDLIAAGVSVPTEPGAPDPALIPVGNSQIPDHAVLRNVTMGEVRAVVAASQPVPAPEPHPGHPAGQWACAESCVVPAPEPSARLDAERLYRALLAVENHGAPIVPTDYLAIAAAYAADAG